MMESECKLVMSGSVNEDFRSGNGFIVWISQVCFVIILHTNQIMLTINLTMKKFQEYCV